MAENQKERIMRILNVSAEEADEILKDDKAIDRGERMSFDLSPEQEKLAAKLANVRERKKPITFDKKPRERKPNATKGGLIAELATFLTEKSEFSTENVEITNKERQIAFKIGEDCFELTLVQKRKPKK
jgi:hypothetical protein